MTEPQDRFDNQVTTPEVETDTATKTGVEEFKVSGDTLLQKINELIHEGNIRRILIKNESGQVLFEIPLTAGLVGGVIGVTIFPFITAVAAIGAMVARLTLVIEKKI